MRRVLGNEIKSYLGVRFRTTGVATHSAPESRLETGELPHRQKGPALGFIGRGMPKPRKNRSNKFSKPVPSSARSEVVLL